MRKGNQNRMQIKTSKDAFEALIELYCNLCKTTDLGEAKDVIVEIERVIEEVEKNNFFPIVAPIVIISIVLKGEPITESERLDAAREMYDLLGRLIFCFEEANIVTMRPYMDALEYGRTFVPYEYSQKWGQAYSEPREFSHEFFYFAFLSRVFQMNEQEYQEYALQLKKKIHSVRDTFPKEKALPKKVYEKVQKQLAESYQSYIRYIDSNYAPIQHLFSYYNKRIHLYLHRRSDKELIILMNVYDSLSSDSIVYPIEVNTMYRFHNYEAGMQHINNGVITSIVKDDMRLQYIFGESRIHAELNSIFVKYSNDSELMRYVEYMLRGQMKRVKTTDQQDIISIDGEKYKYILNDNSELNNVKRIINSRAKNIKGFVFRFAPYLEIEEILEAKKIPFYSAEDLGVDMIDNGNGEMVHLYIRERIGNLKVPKSDSKLPSAQLLIDRLENCPTGKDGWVEYENIGTDIFKYLFSDDFRHFKYDVQSYTSNKILRRDLIVYNTYKTVPSFWEHLHNECKSKVVIVDFKNFKEPLDTDEFHKVSKYFTSSTGKFAILFSREGLDENAKTFQLTKLHENEIILCLSDKDIKQMIEQKARNQNPTEMLENMYYALCAQG